MRFLEQAQIAAGFLPVDLSTGTASLREGDWVSLENFNHIAIVLYKDGGTAGDDVTLTVEQATDASGTGAKALNFTTVARKQAADLFTVGQWAKATQPAGNTYTDADSAEQELLWVVEFDADELDVANGYRFVRATVNDVGANAQLGCLFYILTEARFEDAIDKMPGVLS